MITAGTGGAMEPQAKARAGTGWKAFATVIFTQLLMSRWLTRKV